ncbi:predicted protein [Plenodomus lingam JN3]|uniref:Predicted protein n=1 Tax=Leptosphaeria maculans (strain JN3 / isolate v23.1.3 / race Av1-4-5-6-7-8) TaxID=985895 RepID=E4ZXZ0_LEPMJ|nr:predicted protein [Plenodomus lingam JN3]CBX96235.1 predicted protein [Plenodomus lingam JN3]
MSIKSPQTRGYIFAFGATSRYRFVNVRVGLARGENCSEEKKSKNTSTKI